MAPISRLRAFSGPAILSYGFRPFFLFGAIYSGLAILVWLAIFFGCPCRKSHPLGLRRRIGP